MKKIPLEEAYKIAKRNGYESYRELHAELYKYGITLEQYVKNGESMTPKPKKQKDVMPESVFNAITSRIIDLKDQKANLLRVSGRLKGEAKKELRRVEIEIRELTEYQKAHYK
ncbi:MAG: hypothetical protein K5675_04860 [Lachnospiraceae bacterium]|nr:hypothetical protein [Lachnospiraceae bacterium]